MLISFFPPSIYHSMFTLCYFISLCLLYAHFLSLCLLSADFISLCLLSADFISLCLLYAHFLSLCLLYDHFISLWSFYASLCLLYASHNSLDCILSIIKNAKLFTFYTFSYIVQVKILGGNMIGRNVSSFLILLKAYISIEY